MGKRILNRYEMSEEGRLIIDVAVNTVENLYNNFDRNAAFVRKDLD